ncbi:MAG: molybdate ABC transporter permease subunit [Actinobacteria bacterium]|nr:molybdate ABC transporter permease subunit [Actinomycetota bacterium]MCS5688378.1 molybdate ABC transporter permease subunit [Acidimicrobiales bacterium]MEC8922888.1 molybdate ABC transporter permease subunit [Actinomycetota bacterium]MEC9316174.1 molybdate ABC transporter permease subunit [Actinomycetota bacterium]MED5552789.1 molybdate ABC transporter permease subunit [Actinomycetota bacterium]
MTSRLPRILRYATFVAIAVVAAPLIALLWRVPWSDLPQLLSTEVVVDALILSTLSSICAAGAALVLGTLIALQLSNMRGAAASTLRALVTLPMVLPPVVGGAALLFAFGRNGLVGETINNATGLVLPYSLAGVVIANTFVATPFVVLTIESGLRSLDPRYELAAATLGAGPMRTKFGVVLPMIRSSIVAGTFLAWARALGEFGATITFAGNIPGRTQTLPLAVFVAMETDRGAALAMSLLLVVISLTVLVALRDRWWPSQ